MTQPTDRPRLDDLTSDQYDQLCEQLEQAKAAIDLRDAVIDLIKARAEKAEATLTTIAAIFEGFGNLLATSSRDWGAYRVDAWLWAVVLGWDCEETEHDDTCIHGTLEEMAAAFGWSDEAVAKARRYRATVRAVLDQHGQTTA